MLGVNIHPASMQSDDGKKMWDKWRKQGDAKYIKSMNAKMSEGDSGAKYKVRSIGQDKKGEYYVSPSTGEKVYKKAKVGDHEVPGSKEIKPKVEGIHSPAQRAAIAIAKKEKQTDEDQRLDPHCWKGYRKAGTKMKGGTRVNNCVKVGEDVENLMAGYIKLLENK
jgi:hypothetical protein